MADSNGQLFYTASSAISGSGTSTPAFPYTGNATISGSLVVSGSSDGYGGITGSLFGTASYADSASIAITAQTSSYPINYQSGYLYSVSPGMVAGTFATSSNNSGSIFLGYQAAQNVGVGVYNSNFLGYQAGLSANFAYHSNFLGYQAGYQATNANNSFFAGNNAGYQATNASGSNFIGQNAGSGATDAEQSIFIGQNAGINASNALNSQFIGYQAGANAFTAGQSAFIGAFAGSGSYSRSLSIFIGRRAGEAAGEAFRSTFIGFGAGQTAKFANNSTFIGISAGNAASSASFSTFIGQSAGTSATKATVSTFIGYEAGRSATVASHSLFMGFKAGWAATSASYNTLIGYNVGNYTASAFGLISGSYISGSAGAWGNPSATANKLGYNNIIIGNNITISGSTNNAVNIGAVLFISGTYFDSSTTGNPFLGSAGGKMGINVTLPTYSLHVSGTVGFSNLVTSSNAVTNVVVVDSNGQLWVTSSLAVGTTTPAGVKAGSGSAVSFSGSPLASSITFITPLAA
jgi:hypothetical protein